MTSKDKQYIGWAIGVVILVLIFVFFFSKKSPQTSQTNTQSQTQTQPEATSTGSTGTKKLDYGTAIKTYKYRIQFSKCHGTPGQISVAQGSPVMLDNRDPGAHTIKANGQTFRIAGYDYALVYPATVTKDSADLSLSNVTCDGGGAATLNVEK